MKSALALLLSCVLILWISAALAAQPGETVSVLLSFSNTSGAASGVTVSWGYDSSVLLCLSAEGLGGWTAGQPGASGGMVGCMSGSPLPDGPIALLTFQIRDGAPEGTTYVSASVSDAFDTGLQPVAALASGGAVTVACPPAETTPGTAPTGVPVETPIPTSDTDLPTVSPSETTSPTPSPSVSPPSPTVYPVRTPSAPTPGPNIFAFGLPAEELIAGQPFSGELPEGAMFAPVLLREGSLTLPLVTADSRMAGMLFLRVQGDSLTVSRLLVSDSLQPEEERLLIFPSVREITSLDGAEGRSFPFDQPIDLRQAFQGDRRVVLAVLIRCPVPRSAEGTSPFDPDTPERQQLRREMRLSMD